MRLITLLIIFCLSWSNAQAKPIEINDYEGDDVGTYIVNDVRFLIPKKALLVNSHEGVQKDIAILLSWPDMQPAKWKGDQSQVISIMIKPYRILEKNFKGKTLTIDSPLVAYQNYAAITKYSDAQTIKEMKAEPMFLAKHPLSGLNVYKLPYSGHLNTLKKDFFIEGDDAIKPDYWLECNWKRCSSYYKLNDKVMIKYGFRKAEFIHQHKQLREAVTKAINNFILKEGK